MLSARRSLVRARAASDGAVIAVDRDDLRTLVQRDSELSEILMRAFILRRVALMSAGNERPGAARLAPLGQHAAHPGVPEPQRAALHLSGRRDRPQRPGAARSAFTSASTRCRWSSAAAATSSRTRSIEALASALGLERRARRDGGARRRDRRRRAGRARRGRLRRVRGARRAGPREHGARRAGGHELAHRELPRLSDRHLRAGAGGARAHAGREVRRRGRHRAHGRRASTATAGPTASICPTVRWCGRARSSSPPASKYRKLDLPSLARFEGAGVYYCATHLESQLCQGEEIAIVGGGQLGRTGGRVPRGDRRRTCTCWCAGPGLPESMSRYLIQRIESTPNIVLRTRTPGRGARGRRWPRARALAAPRQRRARDARRSATCS